MRRMNSSTVLLFFVVHLTTSSLAAEVQIDEQTLCPTALQAFDAKDLGGYSGLFPVRTERL